MSCAQALHRIGDCAQSSMMSLVESTIELPIEWGDDCSASVVCNHSRQFDVEHFILRHHAAAALAVFASTIYRISAVIAMQVQESGMRIGLTSAHSSHRGCTTSRAFRRRKLFALRYIPAQSRKTGDSQGVLERQKKLCLLHTGVRPGPCSYSAFLRLPPHRGLFCLSCSCKTLKHFLGCVRLWQCRGRSLS